MSSFNHGERPWSSGKLHSSSISNIPRTQQYPQREAVKCLFLAFLTLAIPFLLNPDKKRSELRTLLDHEIPLKACNVSKVLICLEFKFEALTLISKTHERGILFSIGTKDPLPRFNLVSDISQCLTTLRM